MFPRGRYSRFIALVIIDTVIVSLSYGLAYWLRLSWDEFGYYQKTLFKSLPWLLGIKFLCGLLVRQYSWSFGHASLSEGFDLAKAAIVGSLIFFCIFNLAGLIEPAPPPHHLRDGIHRKSYGHSLRAFLPQVFFPAGFPTCIGRAWCLAARAACAPSSSAPTTPASLSCAIF